MIPSPQPLQRLLSFARDAAARTFLRIVPPVMRQFATADPWCGRLSVAVPGPNHTPDRVGNSLL